MTAAKVIEKARSTGLTIATAESCTGGLLAAALTDIPGASEVFDRGYVTYSNTAKTEMLGVREDALFDHGAVSEEVARAMARGASTRAQVDLAISITGIAGPGGSEHKPEGRVCFGVANAVTTSVETVEFGAIGRENVRMRSVEHALSLLLAAMS